MKSRDATTPAKADTGHFENPADAEAMKAVDAARAAGEEDPFGDFDNDEGTPAPAPAPAPAPESEDPPAAESAADEPDAEDPPPAEETVTDPEPEPAPPAPAPAPTPVQFKTRTSEQLQTAQQELMTKKADAFKKYSDGEMSPEDFAKVDGEVMTGLMSLASEQALLAASTQAVQQQAQTALDSIKALAKKQGHVDYDADPTAAAEFDAAAELLAKNPKTASLSDAEFYQRTHDLVLSLRGIQPTAAAPSPAPTTGKPPARQDMRAPITLRDVPAAATPNTNGGLSEELGRLNGLDFEDRIGAIPKAQRDAWLDS